MNRAISAAEAEEVIRVLLIIEGYLSDGPLRRYCSWVRDATWAAASPEGGGDRDSLLGLLADQASRYEG